MRIVKSLQRSSWLMSSLVLLAAAGSLAAQTPAAPALVVSTLNMQFAHQTGTAVPPAQTLRVFGAPGNVTFTATAASTGGWLLVNELPGATGTTGTATQDIRISVNPAALVAQATPYRGVVTFSAGTTNVLVNVDLLVSAAPQVRLDPSVLNISVEAGSSRTFQISVASTNGSAIAYTAVANNAESVPQTNWLVVSPSNGVTGQTPATVTINATAIPSDRRLVTGVLRFQALQTGSGSVSVPITVLVGAQAELSVAPASVTFPYQIGFGAPTSRAVNITSTGATQVLYTATVTAAQNWLTVATAPTTVGTLVVQNTTPNPIYLIPNVAAVAGTAGNYDATVQIQGPAGTTAKTINVRLSITTTPQLTVFQEPSPFVYTLGGVVPQAQLLTVNATSMNLPFTVQEIFTAEGGGDFFNVTPTSGTTPTNLTVSLDTTRLGTLVAGTYSGAVRLTSGTTQLDIPISLTVSGSALITVEGSPIRIEARQGETPTARTIIVRSTDGSNQTFTLSVDPPTTNWLILGQTSGATGATGTLIGINVNPLAITAPGTYEAAVVITPTSVPNAPSFRVPVTYVVSGTGSVTTTPASFTLTQAGTTPPAAQTIQLTSATPGLQFTASTQQPWIKLTQTTGAVPGSIGFTLDSANLAPGEYNGIITVSVSGVQTINIPVKLTVSSAANLSVTPTTLNFTYTQGATAPAAQTVSLSSSGVAIPFTAAVTSTGTWLAVTPTSGTTAAQGGAAVPLSVTVNPTGLAPGTYQGTIAINAPTATTATTNVIVNLVVSAVVVPNNITVANSASGIAGAISPGQLITIYGRNMAPATATSGRVVNNVVQATVGEVRVTFNGIEAPLLYVGPGGGADQINAVVPYGIGNQVSSRMVVEYRSQRSEGVELRVAETNPAIFTQNQTGAGLGAILNQNNTVNTASNPARVGQIIQIYATGEGAVVPAGENGRVANTQAELRQPVAPVTAFVNNVAARVLYAGSAPGAVSGAFQVNVEIPASVGVSAPTQVPIEIVVGPNRTQRGVTVAVAP